METSDLSHHISRRFNEDLERVRTQVLSMGGFVEAAARQVAAGADRGRQRARRVGGARRPDRSTAWRSRSTRSAAASSRRARPTAGDLRLIVAIIKTITDLERIGDEGEKIGYIASRLAAMERPANKYREVKHLGRMVSEMVHDALDAFARMDAEGGAAGRAARTGSSTRNTSRSSASASRS